MLTAEDTTSGALKVVETKDNETTGVEKVVPQKTANTSGFITTPEKMGEVETVKAKGWNEDPKVELLTKALRFLAAKISAETLAELESVFPTL